jgi:hypothetical protein
MILIENVQLKGFFKFLKLPRTASNLKLSSLSEFYIKCSFQIHDLSFYYSPCINMKFLL